MKNLFGKRNIAFFLAGFLLVSSVQAQSTAKSPAEAVEAAANRTLETRTRSMELERVKKDADRDLLSERDTSKKFPEIKEDFEKMQTVNLESLQKTVDKNNPDYKLIGKAAGEIKKRANRLNNSLFPQDLTAKPSEKSAPPDLSKADLKTLSIALDNAIYRFVSNNLFQNIKVVNLDDSIKAQIELKKIMRICSLIEEQVK